MANMISEAKKAHIFFPFIIEVCKGEVGLWEKSSFERCNQSNEICFLHDWKTEFCN